MGRQSCFFTLLHSAQYEIGGLLFGKHGAQADAEEEAQARQGRRGRPHPLRRDPAQRLRAQQCAAAVTQGRRCCRQQRSRGAQLRGGLPAGHRRSGEARGRVCESGSQVPGCFVWLPAEAAKPASVPRAQHAGPQAIEPTLTGQPSSTRRQSGVS
jgi:hypothetical protein